MPKTLLLADDSVTIQKVVGISFANEDIVITTVDNGDDAIAKARELRPHIILADVVMPGKNGYEVCEAIKNDPNLRQTPVLLLTGTFETFDEERATRAGAAGHVAKPFEAQTLVQRVKELLAAPPVAASTPPSPPPAPALAPADAQTDPELGSDQAFDFFDDDGGDFSKAAEPREASPSATLDLDEPEAAFAFGDEDLAVDTQEPISSPPLRGPERSSDATVVLPPERRADPAELSDEAADAFDFGLDAETGREAPVGTEDLAEATLLDPAAGSGFDVSSSDLSPSGVEEPRILASAREPAAAAAPEPSPTLRSSEPVSASSELHLASDPVIDRLSSPPGPTAPVDEGVAPASPRPEMQRPFGVERPVERDDVREAEPASTWPDALDSADEAEPLSLEPEPDDAPFAPVGTTEEVEVSLLSPAVRQELHATLERIAWDAFGPVTEKIVQQALERIEQVAWEVVPKLAETLIQEEIRRLKGDS